MPSPYKVLVADDPGIMRDGLCGLLATDPTVQIAGAVAGGAETLQLIEASVPDLLIIDIGLPGAPGIETLVEVKRRWPQVRVLVLTFRKEDICIEGALRAGADGYVLKNDNRGELYAALQALREGKPYLSPVVYERVVNGFVHPKDQPRSRRSAAQQLTPREREVIRLIAAGQRTREIAQQLSLSHKTVEKHRTNLMRKLGLKTATAVAAYAIANGYHSL
ncbi:MAG TPA: response regulator transcription factor [Steroidobacteraceae bacterium]|nr:response regulator transcription factor [Steroidobacteraceae bacterium]